MNTESIPATSASEQIAEYQKQIEVLKHRAVLELKVQLAEARALVVDLQNKIAEYTGEVTAKAPEAGKSRKERGAVSIEQIVEGIRAGATNYRMLAARLGVSTPTIMRRIQEQGANAGITSVGQKAAFCLIVR